MIRKRQQLFRPKQVACLRLLLLVAVGASLTGEVRSSVWFVRHGSSGPGDGLSWATGFGNIQAGIDAAAPGDEVWVAAGVSTGCIRLKPSVALYGGFAGSETQRTQRDWTRNLSVMDGGGTSFSTPPYLWPVPGSVVTIAAGADSQTRLDGFTIRNGRATFGAGIYVEGGSPVIANNTIVNNDASGVLGGGGLLFDATRTLPPASAETFFKSVAGPLLATELGLSINNIPVFTNGSANWSSGGLNNGPLYTTRLHQLLQITANLWDATRSNRYPTVFRPQFETRGTDVFITNYVEETGVACIERSWRRLDDSADRPIAADDNVYGIPLLLGAKKGFPNFNEFVSQAAVEVWRKLEFVKSNAFETRIRGTNQQLVIGISNAVAVEAWYSYTNLGSYPPANHQAMIRYQNLTSITVTNDSGLSYRRDFPMTGEQALPSESWAGGAFKIPALTVTKVLSNSVYLENPPRLEQVSGNNRFEPVAFVTNRWGLLTTNRFNYFLIERDADNVEHVVDVVSLTGTDKMLDITGGLARLNLNDPLAGSMRLDPTGVRNQIHVSLGQAGQNGDWRDYGQLNPASGQDKEKAIDAFRVYMGVSPLRYPANQLPPPPAVMQAPFIAARKLYQTTSWSANDPLVHHRLEELSSEPAVNRFTNQNDVVPVSLATFVSLAGNYSTLSNRNREYRPWGGRSGSSNDPNDYNSSLKDPGTWSPDYWNFPVFADVNLGWLDRVHRGTPWQTLYFGSISASPSGWRNQTGGASDARTYPTNDWRMIEAFLNGDFLPGTPSPSSPVLVNNTLAGNTATRDGGGIFIASNAAPVLVNNIIALGSSGVFSRAGNIPPPRNNSIVANSGYDSVGLPDGLNVVTSPPMFVSPSAGNFQLRAGSPGLDAADETVFGNGWIERVGPSAIQGGQLDLGAHEFGPQSTPVLDFIRYLGGEGMVEISLQGFPAQNYILDASEDLVSWTPIATNSALLGEVIFSDQTAPGFPHRFYRARPAD